MLEFPTFVSVFSLPLPFCPQQCAREKANTNPSTRTPKRNFRLYFLSTCADSLVYLQTPADAAVLPSCPLALSVLGVQRLAHGLQVVRGHTLLAASGAAPVGTSAQTARSLRHLGLTAAGQRKLSCATHSRGGPRVAQFSLSACVRPE